MEIIMYTAGVKIQLSPTTNYDMSWDSLDKVEKAIKLIRELQKIVPIESASITVT